MGLFGNPTIRCSINLNSLGVSHFNGCLKSANLLLFLCRHFGGHASVLKWAVFHLIALLPEKVQQTLFHNLGLRVEYGVFPTELFANHNH